MEEKHLTALGRKRSNFYITITKGQKGNHQAPYEMTSVSRKGSLARKGLRTASRRIVKVFLHFRISTKRQGL